MAGFRKTHPRACGLWQGFTKGSDTACVFPSTIRRCESARQSRHSSTRLADQRTPKHALFAASEGLPFRTLRPSSTSISRWFRRFLGACKRASGLLRLELLACLQVPRLLEVIQLKLRGSVISTTTTTTTCSAVNQRQVNISIFTRTYIHTYIRTCMPAKLHTYIHIHTRAQLRARTCGSGKANASRLARAKQTHAHPHAHAPC